MVVAVTQKRHDKRLGFLMPAALGPSVACSCAKKESVCLAASSRMLIPCLSPPMHSDKRALQEAHGIIPSSLHNLGFCFLEEGTYSD